MRALRLQNLVVATFVTVTVVIIFALFVQNVRHASECRPIGWVGQPEVVAGFTDSTEYGANIYATEGCTK